MIVKLPVATLQVGCVTTLVVGTTGVNGCAFTITFAEETEVQVPKVAVIVYVPSGAVIVPELFITPADGENV